MSAMLAVLDEALHPNRRVQRHCRQCQHLFDAAKSYWHLPHAPTRAYCSRECRDRARLDRRRRGYGWHRTNRVLRRRQAQEDAGQLLLI